MTGRRILCAVAMACAIVAAPAYAKPIKKNQLQFTSSFSTNEDCPASRPSCTASPAAVNAAPMRGTPRQPVFATATAPAASSSSSLVQEARRYIGTNPTNKNSLWCARFMNMVLERTGYRGTGSDLAKSFSSYGHRISGPAVGAIAVMSRGKRGGHVGVVSGVDAAGNVVVVSGNHGHRVAEAAYPPSRIFAYVMPGG